MKSAQSSVKQNLWFVIIYEKKRDCILSNGRQRVYIVLIEW
jgi:hypothetical protein